VTLHVKFLLLTMAGGSECILSWIVFTTARCTEANSK